MRLSIVIVNYNVKHFIEQCLHSVGKAIARTGAEVFVVDNSSVDGSCAMIKQKFPHVKLIENKNNVGFAKANNQAIKLACGEYILLLNPDTIVEEDSFEKLLAFADENPDAGGFGVKMIDGKGNFLPESKRAFPSPMVSFYKSFGLSRLFPHSKRFARYHLGHLDKNKNHEIEVLAGAFMLLRKSVIDKTGMLDESFFMYGEDIDLSYRITLAGYKNMYFADTTIIHYKGESTKKSSINYVMVFYQAMIIFARKHFSQKNARLYIAIINMAIYFRATLAIGNRFIKNFLLPMLDAALIFAGYLVLKPVWESYKFGDSGYPDEFLMFAVPAYIIVWLTSVYFSGGYERPIKLQKIAKGLIFGTMTILVMYSLLNEEYRFSRALILLGFGWSFLSIQALRLALHFSGKRNLKINFGQKKRIVIAAGKEEATRIFKLINQIEPTANLIGVVAPGKKDDENYYLGNVVQLREIVQINQIDEVIFSALDISAQQIIQNMYLLSDVNVDYKIAPPESMSVIGSNSIETAGDLYVLDNNSISKKLNIRKKRLLDILISLSILALSPALIWFQENRGRLFSNIFKVIFGISSWVGYYTGNDISSDNLPKLKPAVLSPADAHKKRKLQNRQIEKLNMIYCKDYTLLTDLSIIYYGWKQLGR
ncbi:MAG: glycosyltransferase [Bacteroidota bacterium]|nr:glycosyltransferase [Bacteroidota bacterium]